MTWALILFLYGIILTFQASTLKWSTMPMEGYL
ncbi:MAG: hypothetical protein M3162_07475 [Thermoproteota archaeon]|nr:hypothetical protein [Thermoproteota archaeon]